MKVAEELVQQGLEIATNNPEALGVGVPEVRCGACKAAIVRGWQDFAQHVLDEHQDDEHRVEWARNALADLVERKKQAEADAEQRRIEELVKQDRLAKIRARVERKKQAQAAKLLAVKERETRRLTNKTQRASNSGGHSWLYWLFTPRPKASAGTQVATPTRLALPPALSKDEAMRRVSVIKAAEKTSMAPSPVHDAVARASVASKPKVATNNRINKKT